ncbi:hypothetical protein ACQ1Q5_06385 [Ornithobacterium rhinotracheale]
MDKTINIEQIEKEMLRYVKTEPKVLQAAVMSKDITLNKHAKTITKVRGEYPSIHSLLGHVVQGFDSKKWTPFSVVQFRKKISKNFHQKVDFELDPAEIIGSVLESWYDEGKPLEQKGISKHAIDLLKQKIISDVEILSITGEYNAAKIGLSTPEFGYSMDGLNTIVKNGLKNSDNPFFLIPGNEVTEVNILDEVLAFERALPKVAKNQVKKIFMSDTQKEAYQLAYEDKYGQNQFNTDQFRTRLGKREIVGLPGYTGPMFATVENGLIRLVDIIDNPATITDVQRDKRILNILGEFTLGYDFAINELTFVHTSEGGKQRGLNNAELNALYYPEEKLTA